MIMKSFNQLNNIFENQIPQLYNTNEGKKTIGKYIKLIREDNILKEQYLLFNQLKKGVNEDFKTKTNLVEEYVNYIPTIFEKYTKKQISEANEKLYKFFIKEGIDTDTIFNENEILKAAEYLIYEGKTDIEEYITKKNALIEGLKIRDKVIEEEKKSLDEIISDFNEKYEGKLTNEEISLIKDLILCGDSIKKKETLKEYQKDCLSFLNKTLEECFDIDIKERLLLLKEQVLFEDGNDDVSNIIKLSEIKGLLGEMKGEN
jgi:hypothetical protein